MDGGRPLRSFHALPVLLLLVSAPALAYVIILKDGTRLVAKEKRRSAEDPDDQEARPLHVRDLASAREHVADLHRRRGDGDPGRDEDVAELEGDEEEDDREKVEEELQIRAICNK